MKWSLRICLGCVCVILDLSPPRVTKFALRVSTLFNLCTRYMCPNDVFRLPHQPSEVTCESLTRLCRMQGGFRGLVVVLASQLVPLISASSVRHGNQQCGSRDSAVEHHLCPRSAR